MLYPILYSVKVLLLSAKVAYDSFFVDPTVYLVIVADNLATVVAFPHGELILTKEKSEESK